MSALALFIITIILVGVPHFKRCNVKIEHDRNKTENPTPLTDEHVYFMGVCAEDQMLGEGLVWQLIFLSSHNEE